MTFKQAILEELSASHWEVVEQSTSTPWWVDEWWRVRSTGEHHGYEAFLLFLVDPADERPPGVRRRVDEVAVFADLPDERPFDRERLASLDMNKGFFREKLAVFSARLDEHRLLSPP